MHIRKGDNIIIIAGKDRGKEGKILQVFSRDSRVLIEGMNMKKKHQRARKQGQKGQIIDVPHPVHISNVMLKDPKTGKPTRVSFVMKGDKKARIAKKSGTEIS